jgi:CHAT domain-containing protein
VLTAAELETFGYSGTDLVCLLGCSAGSGRVLQADEPASLAETFLKLGSATVIAPMWDAHIEPSGAWITRFFEAWLREGKPKAFAARDATAEALRSYGPQLAGVLTLRGDWL